MDRRKIAGLFGAALAVLVAPAAAEDGVTDKSIKLGMFGPLTGPVSIFGYPINNGAIAVYKEVNAQGGIHGRTIDIVHEDGACDPAKTRAAVKKLIHSDKVFAVHGGSCSAAVVASRDEFVENKIPFMVMAATVDKISEPANKYVFTTTLPASGDGGVILNFAKSIPGAKKMAMIKHTDEWADAKVSTIVAKYKEAGIELVAEAVLDRRATDATAQVLKIKQANPDFIVFALYPAESAVFLRDAQKYGLKGPYLGTNAVMDILDLAERAGSKEAVKDVYVSAFLRGPIGSKELASYTELYRKHFPNDKVQSLSFYGMSGALTVVDALKRAGKDLTRDKYLAALEAVRDGDAGPAYCKVNFSAQRRQGCLDGTMWRLVGDQIVNIGPAWKATN